MKIQFTVYGNPKAQKRHRDRKGGHGKYDPSASDKGDFLAMCIKHKPERPIVKQGVLLWLNFFMPRPDYHFNSKGEVFERYKDIPHIKIPDCDNLAKFVKDALAGVYWHNDSLIVKLTVEKQYSPNPRIEVCVVWDDAEGGGK